MRSLARKRAIAEKARAEARAAFGGGIYLARCVYTYGWQEYGVYAKDAEHAQFLVEQWLRSDGGQSEMTTLHADAISNYQSAMEDYRDAIKDYRDEKKAGMSDEELGLSRPQTKPRKTEFKLSVETITKSNLDTEDFEIEEVQFQNASDGWDHDMAPPQNLWVIDPIPARAALVLGFLTQMYARFWNDLADHASA